MERGLGGTGLVGETLRDTGSANQGIGCGGTEQDGDVPDVGGMRREQGHAGGSGVGS